MRESYKPMGKATNGFHEFHPEGTNKQHFPKRQDRVFFSTWNAIRRDQISSLVF